MAFELDPGLFDSDQGKGVTIRIVGVGGCGGNAVNNMIDRKISGAEYIVFNTDRQALLNSKAPIRVQIGKKATSGLGAGADPSKGRQAAEDDRDIIAAQLKGADLVFIAAGMGKGTGTGAAPVIASIARNMGILTIGVVTRPFNFEGQVKARIADGGINELRKFIDTLIVVENEKILSIAEDGVSATEAFNMANDVLYRAAKGIADIITRHGHVNVDFADVKSIMSGAGDAVMGSAASAGERRALKAASDALNSPLLEGVSVRGAKGVLVNITGEVTMRDMTDAMNFIEEQVGGEAKIINGYVDEPQISGEIRVTVIVTGFRRTDSLEPSGTDKGMSISKFNEHRQGPVSRTVRSVVTGLPEKQEEDLRIPTYIRRQISIHDPLEVGMKKRLEQSADNGTNLSRSVDEQEDQIQKGLTELPAYLRRKNNGS
ncbi:MAG: cell division protein FtsZ [Chlorobium sp.]|jgi:cell division protein FtsZ|uniref:cell division protein FtsZ n=1 Tax=Chlorobium sp. TaxID=1095 RepID=UPI001DEC625D|nr:cell division protein FtsZ [Chlorobium sp.]MBN1279022.1 cell division protein FtsZ [Chlorobiaceae bacterium]MCF8216301.1 cell division protein FtsZ [Chlorobium sp.]MCF8271203.1 cell division protein FtsZ [Chlorobium sp.]MCF8287577.1 cell division protein FtsZ [Chlorobium sp.]MCF8291116.1 cell division protein FtsZ [Chlorobium sp.]